jgi:hypothetical protein
MLVFCATIHFIKHSKFSVPSRREIITNKKVQAIIEIPTFYLFYDERFNFKGTSKKIHFYYERLQFPPTALSGKIASST